MPITSQQKKAIRLNQLHWRSAKHLATMSGKIKNTGGRTFLSNLDHAVRVKWLDKVSPGWGNGIVYYRLTTKGRKHLKKHRFEKVLAAFRIAEAIKLSASRAELQGQGWFSVKHVGWVDDKLIEDGHYEEAVFFRRKMNGTFFRLTKTGKAWAKKALRSRMEAELRAEFRERRAEETKILGDKLADPTKLICAWIA